MKKNILLLFLGASLVFSCSSDDSDDSNGNPNGNPDDTIDLVGTWVLDDLRIDSSLDDDDLDFAKQILDFLRAEGCDILVFTFNADQTVVSDSKADFIAPTVGTGGLVIPCPDETDTETSTWSLDGNQLTVVDEDMQEETITITLEDANTLIIAGEDIDENNYTGADAVFERVQ